MAEESTKSPANVLDQSEIDKLVAPGPETPPAKGGVLAADDPEVARKAEAYDFRNPAFLSEPELRRLRMLHEDFIRYVSARLSLQLRMDFGLKLAKLSTVTYAKFTDSLANLTHLSLFKIEPLVGIGILDLNPRLALTISDRLLGGRGQSIKAERGLTEIEIALIEDVLLILLEEWCTQWKSEQPLRPAIIGHENNGRFLQTSPRDAIMLAMNLECTFGDCAEQIQIAIPYYTIEPVVKKMQVRRQKEGATTPSARRPEWQSAYDRIDVPVRAEWDAFEVPLREISSLRVGDVLEMRASLCAETRLLLNGVPKFIGTVGLDSDRVAVQLTHKIPPEDSFHAKPD
jgi:flagellar motor switch protein FliM